MSSVHVLFRAFWMCFVAIFGQCILVWLVTEATESSSPFCPGISFSFALLLFAYIVHSVHTTRDVTDSTALCDYYLCGLSH